MVTSQTSIDYCGIGAPSRTPRWATLVLVLVTFAELGVAEIDDASPAQRGLEIFREADRRDAGYGDMQVELEMILRTARGDETRRYLEIKSLEVPDDGDKILVLFDYPKNLKGTALLSYAHRDRDDDQWLYLPALRRVKKITARNKSGPFLGSEFAFEDLTSQEIEKFTYRFIEETELGGAPHFVVERVPRSEWSGYTRQVVWLDVDEYRISRIDYYDRKETLLKTLIATDYERHNERFWRARQMMMRNHQTGRSTELVWSGYAFGTGLTADRDFTTNSLQRSR